MNNKKELGPEYIGEIVLSDFHEAEVMTLPRSGGLIKGIFIPIGVNGLYCDRKGRTTGYVRIVPKDSNPFHQTHLMQISVSKKRLEQIAGLGYTLPIIGNFKKKEKKKITLDIDEILKR